MIITRKKVYRLYKGSRLLRLQRWIKPKHPSKLAKKRQVIAPNQLWEIDLKYGMIAGENRFFFIMSVIDVFDRVIIDYHVGLSCSGSDAADILQRAHYNRQLDQVVARTDKCSSAY